MLFDGVPLACTKPHTGAAGPHISLASARCDYHNVLGVCLDTGGSTPLEAMIFESIADPTISVDTIEATESDRVVELLVQAFEDDPSYVYAFASLGEAAKKHWVRVTIAVVTRLAFQNGTVIGARISGNIAAVGLWYPPTSPYPPPGHRLLASNLRLLPLIVHARAYYRACRLYGLQLQLKPRHVRCWYLAGLAVDKAYRSRGLGSLILRDGLARALAQDTPVLLHCWSRRLEFYRRRGFIPLRSKTLPGMPEMHYVLVNAANDAAQHASCPSPPAAPQEPS